MILKIEGGAEADPRHQDRARRSPPAPQATATLGLDSPAAVRHAGDHLGRGQAGPGRAEDRQQQGRVRRAVLAAVAPVKLCPPWDDLTDPAGIAALAAGALALIALVATGVLALRVRRLRAAQQVVLGPRGATDLVAHAARLQEAFGALHERVEEVAGRLEERMADGRGAARRRDHLPRARPLRRLRRAVRPPVGVARAARRAAQRRRAVLDRAPRHRAAVLQAGRRRPRRASALARGGRGDPARARRRARRTVGARGLMRAAYLGPAGDQLARRAASATGRRRRAGPAADRPRGASRAVQDGEVERGLVPIENSREGAVGATLDALVFDAPDVAIVGEVVHRVTYCLVGGRADRAGRGRGGRTRTRRPPAQCARFLRDAAAGRRDRRGALDRRRGARRAEGGALAGDAPARGDRDAARGRAVRRASCSRRTSRTTRSNATRFAWIARAGGRRERAGGGPRTRRRSSSGAAATGRRAGSSRCLTRVLRRAAST